MRYSNIFALAMASLLFSFATYAQNIEIPQLKGNKVGVENTNKTNEYRSLAETLSKIVNKTKKNNNSKMVKRYQKNMANNNSVSGSAPNKNYKESKITKATLKQKKKVQKRVINTTTQITPQTLTSPSKLTYPTQKTSILDTPISINVRNVPLTYLTSIISNQIDIPIIYRSIGLQTLAGGGSQSSSSSGAQSEMFTVSYVAINKPLYQVLDELTSMVNLYWKYEDNEIIIYQFKSHTFRLAIPWLNETIDTKDGDITLSYKKDILSSIQKSLQALLFNKNSKVSVDQSGFVFAYATKKEMDRLKNSIREINKTFTTPIPLKVGVYLISDDNVRQLGVNWNYLQPPDNGIKGTASLAGGMLSEGQALPNGSSVGTIFNLSVVGNQFNVQLQALEQKGIAHQLEDDYLQALNGQPVVWKPQTETTIISNFQLSYVQASTGTSSSSTTTVPTITTQTQNISTGEELILVPYFIDSDDNEIAVQVYRKNATLQNLNYQNIDLSGFQNQIALPTVQTSSNINQTILKRGQTLLLFTNAQTLKQMEHSGIPFLSDIPVLGYLFKTQNNQHQLYRVIITLSYK